jgi:uncharacterized protein YccT (UPF0319 family)
MSRIMLKTTLIASCFAIASVAGYVMALSGHDLTW